MYTTLQNTPLSIDLTIQALSTGWTVSGTNGIHEVCNTGIMYLNGYPLISGKTYVYTYRVNSISGGNVQARLGTATGSANTTAGFKSETVTAAGINPIFSFYSNADCNIDIFTIQEQLVIPTKTKQLNTISYNEKVNKWVSFYSFIAEIGFSIFTNFFTAKNGSLYLHESGTDDRCNFYGIQYDAVLNFVSTAQSVVPKSFQSLSIQSNELLITTIEGITTSLGQISELSEQDFNKDFLTDGISQINVYDKEGIYSACFLRDINDDLENGTPLKGTYIQIELKTINSDALQLFTVQIISNHSAIGAR